MTNRLEDDIQRMVARMENKEQQNQEQERPELTDQEAEPEETIHIHYFPDAIVLLKEEDTPQVVDSAPVLPQKTSCFTAYAICGFYLLLILSCLAFQCYYMVNPPLATITILPKAQTVTLTGILQVGRVLSPLTISQSQTAQTTGKGHQDARKATGTVTFYNGQQTAQIVAAGTIFTDRTGVSIETTQPATIPPGNPSTGYGTVTIPAQAIEAGRKGNIQAGDVKTPIALAVFVKNNPFTGGQDERNFSTVSQQDINKLSPLLKRRVAQSIQAALHGQLTPAEQLQSLPCTPIVTSDHQVGQEATVVKVTVSETCSAVAYNSQTLADKVTALLATQANTRLGTGYSLLGAVQVTVKQATVTQTIPTLTFSGQGTWIYVLSYKAQEQIKHLIAGKSLAEAKAILTYDQGIQQIGIQLAGLTDRIPKNSTLIHIVVLYEPA